MIDVGLGERQGLAHVARIGLAQRVVPALLVILNDVHQLPLRDGAVDVWQCSSPPSD